ncbi:MAG: alpha-amylase family glycosyl hydrolase [Bacteroidetes bacterium]|nr:alpha-amylase family glycosyl hydrolase [Bacteroidota bacterium]
MSFKSALLFLVTTINLASADLKNSEDSVTVTFRTYQSVGNNLFVPGEFNGWGPNSSGSISNGAISQMSWDNNLSAYVKTYVLKIKDASDTRRRMGDSVFQYKFNLNGSSNGWYGDPLNKESNPLDNNNSILRLTNLIWFQVYAPILNEMISKVSASIIHRNSDTVISIKIFTGATKNNITKIEDVISSYNKVNRVLNLNLSSQINSTDYIKLVAKMNNGDSTIYETGGYTINYSQLPIYAKHGVTLPTTQSNDSTTFRIRVGGKKYVVLKIANIGSDPATANSILMNRDPNTHNWWVNLKLPVGDYEYIYEFDDGRQIPDPWGKISGTKGTIFSTTAEGLTADNYNWKNKNFVRPTLDKLIIYELNISEFAGGYFGKSAGQATYQDMIKLLPYFDSLGVNAIELMPINDFSNLGKSGFSWGYDISSYFALEPQYGTPKDFKMFVDSAHSHGISIIIDAVYNHLTDASALWRMQPNGESNPYFKLKTDLRYNEDQLFFFEDLDHWNDETQELVYASIKMWIDDYKVDGFRYDFTQGIGWNINEPTKGILGWINKIANEYQNSIYQIVEHLPESPALVYYSGATSGWHDSFIDKIFAERLEQVSLTDFENLIIGLGAFSGNDTPSQPSSYSSRTEPVNATVNHDEVSILSEMMKGISYADALKRDKLYSTFIFTSLGIPMLWQSMEFGAPRGFTTNTKLNYRPVEWSYYNTPEGKKHFNYFSRLAFQRRKNPALNNGVLKIVNRFPNEKTLVWGFEDSQSNSKFITIANLSSQDRTFTNFNWLANGNWYDIYTQQKFEVQNTVIPNFTIPAYTALMFTNKTNQELGIVTSALTENKNIPKKYNLLQNYPNPFNPITTIEYDLPIESKVKVLIFDLFGREVQILENQNKESGTYKINFNGKNLASGIYFCKLEAGSYTKTIKLNLLK